MADISKVQADQEYDIKDAVARENIGDLSSLNTTAKTSVVAAINEAVATSGGLPTGGVAGQPLIKHSLLDGDAEWATLPISGGGTGATTAAIARDNLGLGSAATKAYALTVTSDGAGLPTSAAVYSAIYNAVGAVLSASY